MCIQETLPRSTPNTKSFAHFANSRSTTRAEGFSGQGRRRRGAEEVQGLGRSRSNPPRRAGYAPDPVESRPPDAGAVIDKRRRDVAAGHPRSPDERTVPSDRITTALSDFAPRLACRVPPVSIPPPSRSLRSDLSRRIAKRVSTPTEGLTHVSRGGEGSPESGNRER